MRERATERENKINKNEKRRQTGERLHRGSNSSLERKKSIEKKNNNDNNNKSTKRKKTRVMYST